MIFVTVGTGQQPFDRLLRAVESFSSDGDVVVQCGSSVVRPTGAVSVDFIPFSELVARMTEARIVITHAGVGSVLTALSVEKRPYVVPRRRRYREAVDDHQVELARRLAGAGLVTLVEDTRDLQSALERDEARLAALPLADADSPLNRELRSYLASCCEPTAATA